MKKVIAQMSVSLDGYVEGPHREIGAARGAGKNNISLFRARSALGHGTGKRRRAGAVSRAVGWGGSRRKSRGGHGRKRSGYRQGAASVSIGSAIGRCRRTCIFDRISGRRSPGVLVYLWMRNIM